MRSRTGRLLTYLALALVCYAISAVAGFRGALVMFLLLGGLLELMFWKELLWPRRKAQE